MKYCHWKDFRVMIKALLTLLLIGEFIAGCATLPPVKAIKSTKDIVGTWKGPFKSNSGAERFTTVTISGDGEVSLINETFNKHIKLRIKNGKAVLGKGGEMTFHEGEGKRILVLHGQSGTGKYTQVK